jgi:hypothetical protein
MTTATVTAAVLAALVAGAVAGASDLAKTVVSDVYGALKALVLRRGKAPQPDPTPAAAPRQNWTNAKLTTIGCRNVMIGDKNTMRIGK